MSQTASRPLRFPFPHDDKLSVEPLYARLRVEQPVVRVVMPYGGEAWLATRYLDVRTVLSDPRFSRAAAGPDVPRVTPNATFGGSVVDLDGADHSRQRLVVAPALTHAALRQLQPRIQQIADQLLDDLATDEAPADLIADYVQPFPIMVMCEALGVPAEDCTWFRSWSDSLLSTSTPQAAGGQHERARENMRCYLAALLDGAPESGVMRLIHDAREQRRISREESVSLASTMLVGGHSTLVSQLSKSFYLLLARPAHWHQLVTEQDLLITAVEELLRYIPLGTGAGNPRIALEDLELSGVMIRAGEAVVVARHSANRDPEVFDKPDDLDLRRSPNPHLGFGFGPHFCAGTQLARIEMRIAIGTVARRLPGLRLAVAPDEVGWHLDARDPRVISLPVRW